MKFKIFLLLIFTASMAVGQIKLGSQGKSKSNGFALNYSNPGEYTIADISVEGSLYLDKVALISLSGLKVGDKIKVPGDNISLAIKKLWKQGLIGDIQIYASKVEGNDIYLTIVLAERPRLSRFTFSGLTKTQQSDLKDKIELIRGRVMTDAVVKNAELAIKRHFYEKGYLNTAVDIKFKNDTLVKNSVVLDIHVKRNKKVKIRNINFLGDTQFGDSKLKSKFKDTGERPRFKIVGAVVAVGLNALKPSATRKKILNDSTTFRDAVFSIVQENLKINVFKSSKFVKEKYEDDKEKLITFYNSKGYRDATIVEDTLVLIDDKSMDINIRLNAGIKYYFRNISWVGNYIHEDVVLDQILGIEKGDVYNLELIDKKLNFNPNGPDISSLYMDDGYLFFSVNPIEVQIIGDSVDVEMRIYEGAQATIRKVYVTGNDRTNDHVIMREIRTLPGQKFSRADLIRTQRELSQLGYFDPEKVTPNPKPNPADETVDIEWELVERPSDQIELSGGWGGSFGFVGTLGLTFNNFSLRNIPHFDKWRPLPVGDGQKLSVRLQANGKRYQSYSASFSEPWLGGRKPQSFGVSYNYSVSKIFNDPSNYNKATGQLNIVRVSVSLGRRLKIPDDYFTLSNSISYSRYGIDRYPIFGFDRGVANDFTFNTTLSRNSIDQPMYPRSGSSVTLSLALTPPYSLFNNIDYETATTREKYKFIEYHKWMFDSKYYLNLVGKLVLETRAHFGYVGAYKESTGVGPFEQFQLGGSGLSNGQGYQFGTDIIGLRGYADNTLVPEDAIGTSRKTGALYNKFVMELRYPVSLNPSATIYVLTFAEAGNNWSSFKTYNPNKLYKSSGVGVRIFMPAFGLLGIDWGYGFDPGPGKTQKSGGQIHFSIGQTLR